MPNPYDVLNDGKLNATAATIMGGVSLNVFYSNPDVTLKKGDFYWAGLNPGGFAFDASQSQQMAVSDTHRTDWSKYLDERAIRRVSISTSGRCDSWPNASAPT